MHPRFLRGVFENLGASVVYSGRHDQRDRQRSQRLAADRFDPRSQRRRSSANARRRAVHHRRKHVGSAALRLEALGATVNWDDASSTVYIELAGAPQDQEQSQPANYDYASYAPPPIPAYDQPYVPVPNYVWQPGYWAWGAYGYFWVPGTWVAAPQPGYYWTPGYWGYSGSRYAWNQGYWAPAVGYYGGVNYGYGYFGNGYNGGRWSQHVHVQHLRDARQHDDRPQHVRSKNDVILKRDRVRATTDRAA